MWMHRRSLCALLTFILAGWAAGQHPNVAKGFHADKVYDFNGVDNVNLYNGNLSLNIPIGQTYGGNGILKYRLALAHNSKSWDQETRMYDCQTPPPYEYCNQYYIKSMPSRRSNAGMGWLVSLGRLLSPDDPTVSPGEVGNGPRGWTYESPDGADHVFTWPPPSPTVDTHYTKDGSFLRLRLNRVTARHEVHFPDGVIHTFAMVAGAMRIVEMRDPYGNRAVITYADNGDWTITERDATNVEVRKHHVRVLDTSTMPVPPAHAPMNYRMVVREIDLAAFDGKRALYSFEYTTHELTPDCGGDLRGDDTPKVKIPRLTKVTLPDGSSWGFAYHTATCAGVSKMVLPTGATMQWTYGVWEMPTSKCRQTLAPATDSFSRGDDPFVSTEGVTTKTVTIPGMPAAAWRYVQTPRLPSGTFQFCTGNQDAPVHGRKFQESRVSVYAPDGTRSEHYFSIWPYGEWPGISEFDESEYGLPYTRSTAAPGGVCKLANGTSLCLSTTHAVADPSAADGYKVLRSTYVRYEGDFRVPQYVAHNEKDDQYRREVESRTLFHDDPEQHFVQTLRSEYDGLGHFRNVRRWGSWAGGLKKVETTNYNPGKPAVHVDPKTWINTPPNSWPAADAPWLLNLYDRKTATDEGGSTGSSRSTLASEYAFDAATGALTQQRTLKNLDGTRSAADLITILERDTLGNVTAESFYGGDAQSVTPLPATPAYRLQHQYAHGTLQSSAYKNGADTVLQFLSAEIDASTGLPKSETDPAGVKTTYAFDTSGRLTGLTPTGAAAVAYTYTPATSAANATIKETVTSTGGAKLKERTLTYDGMGRMITELVLMPGNNESRRDTKYDVMGRKESVSELGLKATAVLPKTEYKYDSFGRPLEITAPDGSKSSMAYTGNRLQVRRTFLSTVSPAASDTQASVTETYDPFGRLVHVEEASGPTIAVGTPGKPVVTTYTYDPGNRLVEVSMVGPEKIVQRRTFDYDGRGFLRWEQHPESAMTSHTYDARGHVLTKTQSAANSHFDLRYAYDRAERILQIESRNPRYGNPGEPEFRLLKTFAYGTANETDANGVVDRRAGKLVIAARYNYYERSTPVSFMWEWDYKVEDQYAYRDDAGRRTERKTTITAFGDSRRREVITSVKYNDLGLPEQIFYPMCIGCGAHSTTDPQRKLMTYQYDAGQLKSITGFVDDLTYWPNGMRKELVRPNGITDVQEVGDMARPSKIRFGPYDRCVKPVITQHPASASVPAGGSTTLSVTAAGLAPLTYEWFALGQSGAIGTTASITVSPGGDTEYMVRVTNACGEANSHVARVTIGTCAVPATGEILAVKQAAGGWILTPRPTARADREYKWVRLSDGALLGTAETLRVETLTQTTTYGFTVKDGCGSATSNVTITVPLSITKTALRADAGTNSVTVGWPVVTGATDYVVERRSGPAWTVISPTISVSAGEVTAVDATVAAGATYAYRVYAYGNDSESDYSNSDVATMRTFVEATPNTVVTAAPVHSMLEAVNSVRAAAGWPAVAWSNILAATDPLPQPGSVVLQRHITSCRARMNEALQALGVPIVAYRTSELRGEPIGAEHINEVQRRAK